MDNKLKIIKSLGKLNIDNQIIALILNKLDKNYSIKKDSVYEYSINKDSKNFKILNLLFYDDLKEENKNKLYKERREQIKNLFNTFKDKKFNLNVLNKILNKINNPNYPIQIAFEFNKNDLEKIKIYFSNINRLEDNLKKTNELIKDILYISKIPDKIKNKEMLGEGIDCVGIDFFKNSKIQLKIYSYFHKKFNIDQIKTTIMDVFKKYNVKQSSLPTFIEEISNLDYEDWGFLYRISENGTIDSAKCWYRLKKDGNKRYKDYKISYLTYGNRGLEIYFREFNSENRDYFFKLLTEKIAETDFTGYTIQYPPMFLWKKAKSIKNITQWQNISKEDRLGIYIHIPFCNQKCNFCRYFSKKRTATKELDKYLNYLEKEINLYSVYFKNKKIHSLYIGGGTPSILNKNQLIKLFKIIILNFNFIDNAQKCIEVNPSSTNYEKLKIMKEFDINRLTIGIQTLTKNVLENMNRKQTEEEAIEALKQAKKLGFENVNVDLMSGLPGETINSFKKTVEKITDLRPDMIHIHPFYPTPYTQFMKSGNCLSNNAMDLRYKMTEIGSKMLQSKGYNNIKFDALGKKESARNIQLSDAIEHISSYIGFGPGAISHIKGKLRYVNFDNIDRYYSNTDQKKLPIMQKYKLTEKDEMIYYVTSCLRYGNVSKKGFYKLFDKKITEIFREIIEYLATRGIMVEDKNNIYLNFKNIGEYLIYSKYFYDKKTLEKIRQLINYGRREKNLSKEGIRYMCL